MPAACRLLGGDLEVGLTQYLKRTETSDLRFAPVLTYLIFRLPSPVFRLPSSVFRLLTPDFQLSQNHPNFKSWLKHGNKNSMMAVSQLLNR